MQCFEMEISAIKSIFAGTLKLKNHKAYENETCQAICGEEVRYPQTAA